MTHASQWTQDLVTEASYLYLEQKFSAGAIANIFATKYGIDFTRNAIVGKLNRAGAKRAPTSANLAIGGRQPRTAKPVSKPKPLEPLQALFVPTIVPQVKRDPKPLLECEDDGCRFECSGQDLELGDVSVFLFCNQPVREGDPYCAKHCKIAYLPQRNKNQKRAA